MITFRSQYSRTSLQNKEGGEKEEEYSICPTYFCLEQERLPCEAIPITVRLVIGLELP